MDGSSGTESRLSARFSGVKRFATTLRFSRLSATVDLLAGAGGTGRLGLTHGVWRGEVLLQDGEIFDATLGAESGLAALDGLGLGFLDGRLTFAASEHRQSASPLLGGADQRAYLEQLDAERSKLRAIVPSLALVPRVADTSGSNARPALGAAALELLAHLGRGEAVEQIAIQRGLARTLRDLASVVEAGLVVLEASSADNGTRSVGTRHDSDSAGRQHRTGGAEPTRPRRRTTPADRAAPVRSATFWLR
jgi:hypothetical protein